MADEKIKQLNTDLQANVLQLELSNKELESFSYSVSHDLRAPLRALSAFSNILERDYILKLDDEAKRMIGNIKASALKMGVLIDDLLEFSRLGRKEVQKSLTDMQLLVENVLLEVGNSTKHIANIKVNPLPSADVDPGLLTQVWINLISNAIKYSGKKENPEIEVGSMPSEAGTIFYVKDNGTGFDMKYAGKLFNVFQRLHSTEQFEGTGVGLAIVYRIITKHGGRIWADAKLNEGATFYFTIAQMVK
ncbi:MAG: ATP-binding protein [Ferruginibacter sp.]